MDERVLDPDRKKTVLAGCEAPDKVIRYPAENQYRVSPYLELIIMTKLVSCGFATSRNLVDYSNIEP